METMPYIAKTGKASIVIFEKEKIRTFILDSRKQWSVGRETPVNIPDIVLYSEIAGRQQGQLVYVGEQWFWVNGESRNGTYYNEKKIHAEKNGSIRPVMLNNGDVLRIDSSDFSSPNGVWILFTTDNIDGNWILYSLRNKQEVVIGRDPNQSEIVLPKTYISARHAKITYLNGKHYLTDCQSTAGTWVNGKRISTSVILEEKDRISLCDCHFIYSGGSLIYNEKKQKKLAASIRGKRSNASLQQKNVILHADIKSKKVLDNSGHGMKELIRDVKLEIHEGTLVALLGGSGAGKSTVMNCLNGMDTKGVNGTILFNNEDLYANFDRLKFSIGSVPQENVMYEMMTVEEQFKDAAERRLPRDMPKKEVKQRIDEIIRLLSLESVRKSKIQKISGGEKRRVNIGIDLLADRKLLCLDEPDAGLDPMMKTELFKILRSSAHDSGTCILVIIHDVSDIDLFDQMIMMVKYENVGRLVFSGSPREAKEYFGVEMKDVYSLLERNPQKYVRG